MSAKGHRGGIAELQDQSTNPGLQRQDAQEHLLIRTVCEWQISKKRRERRQLSHLLTAHPELSHLFTAHLPLSHLLTAHLELSHLLTAHLPLSHLLTAHTGGARSQKMGRGRSVSAATLDAPGESACAQRPLVPVGATCQDSPRALQSGPRAAVSPQVSASALEARPYPAVREEEPEDKDWGEGAFGVSDRQSGKASCGPTSMSADVTAHRVTKADPTLVSRPPVQHLLCPSGNSSALSSGQRHRTMGTVLAGHPIDSPERGETTPVTQSRSRSPAVTCRVDDAPAAGQSAHAVDLCHSCPRGLTRSTCLSCGMEVGRGQRPPPAHPALRGLKPGLGQGSRLRQPHPLDPSQTPARARTTMSGSWVHKEPVGVAPGSGSREESPTGKLTS
ncbi:hypothetical protein CB1_000480003 [Camelus ferus]|nr:hypothetical protein CB1_000480003 [Camelus ferus]